MNIEEERKAFDAAFSEQYPAIHRACKSGDHAAQSSKSTAWAGWTMAKAHAAEMAKPAVRIVYEIVKSAEQDNFGEILFDGKFHSVSCEEWATRNGYRVIQ